MERPTFELTLPDCGAVVHLYEKLTHGDFLKIQAKLLEKVEVDPTKIKPDEPLKLGNLSATVALDMNRVSTLLAIAKIVSKEGEEIGDKEDFIYNLSIPDGNLLFEEVNRISDKSQLNKENKKK